MYCSWLQPQTTDTGLFTDGQDILIALFWTLNWSLNGLRTNWGFFPLWLGYILTVDAWCFLRQRRSILHKGFFHFIGLFLISAPFWWIFELIDMRTQYWIYLGREQFSDLQYFLYATLSFSTVVPAVFETTFLLSTFHWFDRFKNRRKLNLKNQFPLKIHLLGWALMAITLWKPQYSAAFLWMSLYCIMDPVNYWLGNPSLLRKAGNADWSLVVRLSLGCLICGFFWEMWNFYSYPKWTYDVPYVDFWHVFEMPLPGYLGYIPFGLDIFAFYQLVRRLLASVFK